MKNLRELFLNVERELGAVVIERFDEIHGFILALLTKTNILLLGEPGVAKSLLVNRMTTHLVGGKKFDTLLTAFSTPEELFGPPAMSKMKQDIYERVITGMLPEAHLAFLDEIFKANSGILNSLLTLMNERKYRNGTTYLDLPLLTLIGASNEIPAEEDGLGALFDRFQLKYQTLSIQEPGNFMLMLEMPMELSPPTNTFTLEDLEEAQKDVENIEIPQEIIQKLAKLREELKTSGYYVTDRTFNMSRKILKAEAWLRGNKEVSEDDIDILRHMFWQDPGNARGVYMKVLELTNPDKNKVIDIYTEVMRLAKELFNEKDPTKSMSMGVEYAGKFREAKKNIVKLMKQMEHAGKNVEEVKSMLRDIDTQLKKVFVETLNITIPKEGE